MPQIPHPSVVDYSAILKAMAGQSSLGKAAFWDELSTAWISAYKQQANRKTNITEMWFNGFGALVDLEGSDHGDGRGPQPPGVFPRTICAYGTSKPPTRSRGTDDQRLRGMEPTAPELNTGRDKGHFIAHSIGGSIVAAETNAFSQRRDLNRGWSPEGKRFRMMEQFASANPGTQIFHRPIYIGETDIPEYLEVGIIRPDLTVWIDTFDNGVTNAA